MKEAGQALRGARGVASLLGGPEGLVGGDEGLLGAVGAQGEVQEGEVEAGVRDEEVAGVEEGAEVALGGAGALQEGLEGDGVVEEGVQVVQGGGEAACAEGVEVPEVAGVHVGVQAERQSVPEWWRFIFILRLRLRLRVILNLILILSTRCMQWIQWIQ